MPAGPPPTTSTRFATGAGSSFRVDSKPVVAFTAQRTLDRTKIWLMQR